MRKYFLITKVLSFLLLITAINCGPSYYRTYTGPQKSMEQVAMLVSGSFKFTFKAEDVIVRIVSVDGRTGFRGSGWDGRYKIELLPGEHTITVRYSGLNRRGENIILMLNAKPGHTYIIKPKVSDDLRTWEPYIVDVTDQIE